ncbi:MAG TPA: thiamine pyrophosphate-dependent enzyme [bacterium]|nr:thiamine pyrophosphate-dependent enzyme [bacterium]
MKKRKPARPQTLKEATFHYCPGCGHSVIHRLTAEVIHELGIADKAIGVPPAGCAVLAYFYFDIDMTEAPHGRGCAVATGIKRALPESVVFSYQGDGDLAAIGTAEVIHAANRGENITVIFVNNAVYGMTGGQMAPTSLLGMKTTTSPKGRDHVREGYPVRVCELLSSLDGAVYLERTAVNSVKAIRKTKKAIREAFQTQINGEGFSLVEILSPCPTNWKLSTVDSWKWIDDVMSKYYQIGLIKDTRKGSSKDAD